MCVSDSATGTDCSVPPSDDANKEPPRSTLIPCMDGVEDNLVEKMRNNAIVLTCTSKKIMTYLINVSSHVLT